MCRTLTLLALSLSTICTSETPMSLSGIYPHLAYYNGSGECGTGAVVPWAERLWVITYAPHAPMGSDDKLYEIDSALTKTIRPESVGGTPANRLIHLESQQLFIGPYIIDAQRQVRVIPPKVMPGRLTGTARHLSDPANKVYMATMEEGFYEIDVKSLAVTMLYQDANTQKNHGGDLLPGYHGKGLYSGQGLLVYANNGELSSLAQRDPRVASGILAEWKGKDWNIVRRNQFTEVSGPGGIEGNNDPVNDPLWSIGWDDRSLMLYLLDKGDWQRFRLPKASFSYDGAHGWNTEWPRIRNVGTKESPDLLMTMHGMFWKFPISFSRSNTAGIRPRSSYLKIVGDFCRWNDMVVLGCDDSAKSEFLNKRAVKGGIAGPEQSHSNLWFLKPEQLDQFGPTTASGSVWQSDAITAGTVSDPFLFTGWQHRTMHVKNDDDHAVNFVLEVDVVGNGKWTKIETITVPAHGALWRICKEQGEWARITAEQACKNATVQFSYSDQRERVTNNRFAGLASITATSHTGGLLRALGGKERSLGIAAMHMDGMTVTDVGYYELNERLQLQRIDDVNKNKAMLEKMAIPKQVVQIDQASVLIIDDRGRRWRLPKSSVAYDDLTTSGLVRIAREVTTERDLFNCHGTFYELPAENADGFARLRPIASHQLRIHDYASYRGLLVMSGVLDGVSNPHIIRSSDGKAAVWAGAIDDLWSLGKPTGHGGPWLDASVTAGQPSDPYLFAGYDNRSITLSHQHNGDVDMTIELDLTGAGLWVPWKTITVPTGAKTKHDFPVELQARWVRITANKTCVASGQFVY